MIALLLLLLAACNEPKPAPGAAGPAEAVQAFADAVQKGDAATAWSLLSTKTQKAADEAAARARGAADAGPESGREMLFGSALPGAAVEAKVVREAGDEADVQAAAPDGGNAKLFHAVRESGRWRIDLQLGR